MTFIDAVKTCYRKYAVFSGRAGRAEYWYLNLFIVVTYGALWAVSLVIPQVILVESFLSFLGLGVQEPMSSWGALVSDGAQDMESAPWTLIVPSVFLTVTLYCFNYIGDGLRDALDPKDHF